MGSSDERLICLPMVKYKIAITMSSGFRGVTWLEAIERCEGRMAVSPPQCCG
jgi:hypothetical protein